MARIWHVGRKGDRYRTAIKLWGTWRIHIFWRGDKDDAMHDHPNGFWTFPLMSYAELVWDERFKFERFNVVEAFKWHYRPAEYRHRLLGRAAPMFRGVFVTLVKEGPVTRRWGFWAITHDLKFQWVYWRDYLGEEERKSQAAENPKDPQE